MGLKNMNFITHLKQLLFRHKQAALLGVLLSIILSILSIVTESNYKIVIYLVTMICAFLISEFIFFTGKFRFNDWKIKQPKKELYIILCTQIVVIVLLIFTFTTSVENNIVRTIVLAGRILFVFPIFILIYFIGVKKYSFKQLGILSFNNWYVSVPIIIIIGATTYFTFPESLQFKDVLKQHGISAFLTLGFLTAAIPEEITRVLFQSRLSRVLKNKSWGWFLASLLWALIHIPIFARGSSNYFDATCGALAILPIGLLWGYLNERYKSIIPAVLIHGTNLWGLHNIF